jgi:hypothetical protein
MTQTSEITSRPGQAGAGHGPGPAGPVTGGTERVQGPAFYFPSIEKRYGRPVGEWLDLIRGSELTRHKALVDWLKADYGLGHGHATALVGYVLAQRDDAGGAQQHPAHVPHSR